MNSRILTLFSEETPPEQINAVGKSRMKTRKEKETTAAKKNEKKLLPDLLADWKPEKQYYSIGEVAALFKINTSHIRFWTNEFLLKVRTTKKGDRLYTAEQIYELRNIYILVKEKGFTLTGAKAKLKAEKNVIPETVNLKQSLMRLRNQLMEIKNRIA